MARPAKSETETTTETTSFETEYATLLEIARKPRAIKQARLAEETFWPGKLGEETTLSNIKLPGLVRMVYVPGDGLLLEWKDGSTYTVGAANIQGMEEL